MDGDNFDSNSFDPSSNKRTPKNSDDLRAAGFDTGDKPASRRFQIPGWSKALVLVILVLLASLGIFKDRFFQQKPAPPRLEMVDADQDEVAKRRTLDDFSLTDASGQQKKLSDYRGKVVILSFWASWCTPCLMELPTFAELQNRYRDRGLEVVTVNLDVEGDPKAFAKEFWAKNKLSFASYFDPQKQIAQVFDIDLLPSNFVIDRGGRLAFSSFGANDWSSSDTIDFIESLLAEKQAH